MRYYRQDVHGWTQQQLARAAQVHINSIWRLEHRGVRTPRVYRAVCRALGITHAQIDQWIARQPIDSRLLPLVTWFEALPAREQDLIGQALLLLLRRAERAKEITHL